MSTFPPQVGDRVVVVNDRTYAVMGDKGTVVEYHPERVEAYTVQLDNGWSPDFAEYDLDLEVAR